MSYSREVLIAADTELSRRRTRAEAERLARRDEAVKAIPEISVIERELAETGISVVKSLGMGKGAGDFVRSLAEINLKLQKRIEKLLVENGFDADYLKTKYTCPDCEDTGYINGISCKCRSELVKEIAMERLCRNSPALKCRFDNFSLDYYPDEIDERYNVSPRQHMKRVFEYCKNYAADFDPDSCSLYLYGATGLGKTHLTLAIAGEVTKNGADVVYDSASNLLRRLEKEHFSKDGDESGAEDEMLDCDLLIIDDLGSEFVTSFSVSALYNIINTRLNREKPVIISTNLDAKALEEKYNERTASRILGSYTALLFLGRDIRQLKRNY